MKFEFDPSKSTGNKNKHGLDFDEAQALLEDPDLLEVPVKTSEGPRFLVVGRIAGKHWSGIITYGSDAVRIISVRRARKEEIALYES